VDAVLQIRVPVIQYHKIDYPPPQAPVRGGFTPPKRFAKQMEHLKSSGYEFYTASELIEFYLQRGNFPARGLAITFDDGYLDNYLNAFPVLKQLGIKATMFVVPSCLGQTSTKAVPKGESARPHMTREQVIEMHKFGIEFGSHTENHRLLHEIPKEEVRHEVESAKQELEGLLQVPCKTFAYPAGYYTPEAQGIIAEAGHICAFSTTLGPKDSLDLFAINRMEILRRDKWLFQFRNKVNALNNNSH